MVPGHAADVQHCKQTPEVVTRNLPFSDNDFIEGK